MSRPEIIPGFDCLEYKWRVQEEIYEETKGMTPQEELEYFRKAADTGPLADWWRELRRRTQAASTGAGAA